MKILERIPAIESFRWPDWLSFCFGGFIFFFTFHYWKHERRHLAWKQKIRILQGRNHWGWTKYFGWSRYLIEVHGGKYFMKWIKFLSSYTGINQSSGTGFGLGSKANLDGLVACTVKIVKRFKLKIFQISEWKKTG